MAYIHRGGVVHLAIRCVRSGSWMAMAPSDVSLCKLTLPGYVKSEKKFPFRTRACGRDPTNLWAWPLLLSGHSMYEPVVIAN